MIAIVSGWNSSHERNWSAGCRRNAAPSAAAAQALEQALAGEEVDRDRAEREHHDLEDVEEAARPAPSQETGTNR